MLSLEAYLVTPRSLEKTLISPAKTYLAEDGTLFLDFGRAAFGTLLVPNDGRTSVVVHLGEQMDVLREVYGVYEEPVLI